MAVHERLGIDPEVVDRFGYLQSSSLGEPKDLFDAALKAAPKDPEGAQALLAAALLSSAERATEGRLIASLSLIAQLVAHVDPQLTIGNKGKSVRTEAMPNGWRYMAESYERIRYAWRNGLRELLKAPPELEPIKKSLDEVTRLYPGEPEPVRVHLQEQWPSNRAAGMISIASLALSLWLAKDGLMKMAGAKRKGSKRK